MDYSTIYVGMDVHKETFSLCCYTNEKEKAEYPQKSMHTTVRSSTILRPCGSITETMRCLYADMRQAASVLRCIMS